MKLFADGGYQGPGFRLAAEEAIAQLNVEIVKRSDRAKGLLSAQTLDRRANFAWLGRCRRLAKDWECLNRKGRLPAPRLHPHHATKTLQSFVIFPD